MDVNKSHGKHRKEGFINAISWRIKDKEVTLGYSLDTRFTGLHGGKDCVGLKVKCKHSCTL